MDAPAAVAKSGGTTTTLLSRLTSLDAAISHHLHSKTQQLLFRFLLLLELSADFRFFFPISLSLFLSPSLLRPFLPPLLLGLLLDLVLVALLKLVFRRPRPAHNDTSTMNVAVSVDHFSFPSGHASRVCFVASLAHLYAASLPDPKAVNFALPVWVWAVLTSLSRVFLGRHYLSDVIVGACVGVLEGLFAFHFLRLMDNNKIPELVEVWEAFSASYPLEDQVERRGRQESCLSRSRIKYCLMAARNEKRSAVENVCQQHDFYYYAGNTTPPTIKEAKIPFQFIDLARGRGHFLVPRDIMPPPFPRKAHFIED